MSAASETLRKISVDDGFVFGCRLQGHRKGLDSGLFSCAECCVQCPIFTFVSTWRGFVYVAFVIDTLANRIVGRKHSTSQDTQFVVDALEQAIYARKPADSLIHHSDRGSVGGFKYTERLANAGLEPSVGSVRDSYDNALAETMIGLFKTGVINRLGP